LNFGLAFKPKKLFINNELGNECRLCNMGNLPYNNKFINERKMLCPQSGQQQRNVVVKDQQQLQQNVTK